MRHPVRVWASLETWIVEDGQLPEIAVGCTLPSVGLSLHGELVDSPGGQSPGVVPAPQSGPFRRAYTVTGVAAHAGDWHRSMYPEEQVHPKHLGAGFVLVSDPVSVNALAQGTRAVEIGVGELVSVLGRLAVMGEHEFEFGDDDMAPLARDWTVAGIKVERYTVHWTEHHDSKGPMWSGATGASIDLIEIDRITVWDDQRTYGAHRAGTDESINITYVVDLVPTERRLSRVR